MRFAGLPKKSDLRPGMKTVAIARPDPVAPLN